MTEIVTVRVKKSLKEKARKYKINVSKTMRAALENEIKIHEEEEFAQAFATMKAICRKFRTKKL